MKNPIELTQSSLLEAPSEIIASNLTMGEGVEISGIDENNSLCKLAFKLFENTRSYHPVPRLPGELSWAEATEQEKFKAREDARIKSAREVIIFQDGQVKVESSERSRFVYGRYTLEEAVTLIKIKSESTKKISKYF